MVIQNPYETGNKNNPIIENKITKGNLVAKFSENTMEILPGFSLNFRSKYSLFPQLINWIASKLKRNTETNEPQISLDEK